MFEVEDLVNVYSTLKGQGGVYIFSLRRVLGGTFLYARFCACWGYIMFLQDNDPLIASAWGALIVMMVVWLFWGILSSSRVNLKILGETLKYPLQVTLVQLHIVDLRICWFCFFIMVFIRLSVFFFLFPVIGASDKRLPYVKIEKLIWKIGFYSCYSNFGGK